MQQLGKQKKNSGNDEERFPEIEKNVAAYSSVFVESHL
jgi:hypothetical protein